MTNFTLNAHCKIDAYYSILEDVINTGHDVRYFGLNDEIKREILNWNKTQFEELTYEDTVKYLKLINYIKNFPPQKETEHNISKEGIIISEGKTNTLEGTTVTNKSGIPTDLRVNGDATFKGNLTV